MKNGVCHRHNKLQEVQGLFLDKTSVSEDDCECDLHAHVLGVDKHIISYRYDKNKKKDFAGMMVTLCCKIDNMLCMRGNTIVLKDPKRLDENYNKIKALQGPNMFNIPPMFATNRITSGGYLQINKDIASWHQQFDKLYLSQLLNYHIRESFLAKYVWQPLRERGAVKPDGKNRILGDWDKSVVPSLVVLCLRKTSLFNMVYGTTRGIDNLTYSMHNIAGKIYPALAQLNKPTHSMQHVSDYIAANTSTVLQYMVKLLEVEPFKRSRVWLVSHAKASSRNMPLGSSAGIRAGPTKKEIRIDDMYHNITVNGKKAYHIDYTDAEIDRMVGEFKQGKPMKFYDRAWVDVPKPETLAGLTEAQIAKFCNKVRIFCINTVLLARIERMVHSFRQNIERGSHIAIGTNFWYGGATRIAKKLHCDKDNYTYYSGDFSALDTTLKAQMLMIYSYFTLYYYKEDRGDYKILCEFLKIACDNLVFRPTHVYGDVWKMIFGGMPSGAYETSHGDSWIVMFVFVLYVIQASQRYPSKMVEIRKALLSKDIMFFIYGDDFVLAVPNHLTPFVNVYGLSEFTKNYFDMEMRDLESYSSLLSYPHMKSGSLSTRRTVFLSRYFVPREFVTTRKDIAPILPYRDIVKVVKKLPYGDKGKRSNIEMVLSSIGAAYDTFGTNLRAYQYCKFMYDSAMKTLECSEYSQFVVEHMMSCEEKMLNNIYKKCLITKAELMAGFPTLESLLDRHIYDASKHIYRDDEYAADSMAYETFEKIKSKK